MRLVETGGKKRGRIPEYFCHRARANGACSNRLRMPVAGMNEAVLQSIEEHALTPEAIEQVIQLSERDDVRDSQTVLAREAADVEKRIARVNAAIELGETPVSLLAPRTGGAPDCYFQGDSESQARPPVGTGRYREPAGRMATAAAAIHDAGPHGASAYSAWPVDVHPAHESHQWQNRWLRLRGADEVRQAVHGYRRRAPDVDRPRRRDRDREHRPRGHVRWRLRTATGPRF
jgi:hypothetical protein